MGLRITLKFPRWANLGFALLFLAAAMAGADCSNGKQRLSLTAQFQSSVAKGLSQKQYTCQTVVFPTGEEATNLLVLPTTHFIPVDANEIPENNFEILILEGALFEAQGSLTVQLTCTPTGEGFLGLNIFNVFIGETNFVTEACAGSQCDLNLGLTNFLDQEFILGLSCPSLNFVHTSITLFGFCDPEEDPESLGCTAKQFVEEAAELTDCILLGAPEPDNCGDGVFDSEVEECDGSAEGGEVPCEPIGTTCDPAGCFCGEPAESCGNGVLDEGEECDPTAPDGSAACEVGETCVTPDCVCMPAA